MSENLKPVKKARKERFDYSENIDFIEKKHNVCDRNFAGYQYGIGDTKPHQDFWHWILKHNDYIRNGCEAQIPGTVNCEQLERAPQWVKDIVALIEQDFGEHADPAGYIDVWIEW